MILREMKFALFGKEHFPFPLTLADWHFLNTQTLAPDLPLEKPQPTAVFCLKNPHGWRILAGYIHGVTESDTTEWLSTAQRSLGWVWIQYYHYLTGSNLDTRHVQREDLCEMKCENVGRRWPFTSQEERPQKKPTLPVPWSWTFPELWDQFLLSHPVCYLVTTILSN